MRPLLFKVDVFLPVLRRRNFRYFPLVSRYKTLRRASSRLSSAFGAHTWIGGSHQLVPPVRVVPRACAQSFFNPYLRLPSIIKGQLSHIARFRESWSGPSSLGTEKLDGAVVGWGSIASLMAVCWLFAVVLDSIRFVGIFPSGLVGWGRLRHFP